MSQTQRKSGKAPSKLKQLLDDSKVTKFKDEQQAYETMRTKELKRQAGKNDNDDDRFIVQKLIAQQDEFDHMNSDDDDSEAKPLDTRSIQRSIDQQKSNRAQDDDDEEEEEDDTAELPDKIKYRGAWSDSEEEDDTQIAQLQKELTKKQKLLPTDLHARDEAQKRPKTEEDLQDAQEEEAEVLEAQRKRAARLSKQDYLDQDMIPVQKSAAEEDEDEQDAATLTREEKMELIKSQAPELVALATDLKIKVTELHEQLLPILNKVKSNRVATKDGISYLETKFHLLLSYCINVVFYLLLKASGKPIKNHPVIDNLVEIRLLMEQIKPIDERMKYQIDKLVALASDIETKLGGSASIATTSTKHAPNPDNLMTTDDGNENGADDDEENDAFYKAPKITPVLFDDKETKRQKKDKERMAKKLQNSGMVKALRSIVDEEPEEEEVIGAASKKQSFTKQLEDFEESNMKRKVLSKREKRMLQQEQSAAVEDELENLEQMADLIRLDKQLTKTKQPERVTLLEYVGDEEEARKSAKSKYQLDEMDNKQDDASKKRKRPEHDNKNKRPAKKQRLQEDAMLEGSYEGKRAASKKMLDNRGLTAPKRSDVKNPRVKLRNKFDHKTGNMRAMENKSQQRNNYSGEASIAKSVVRSKKFK